MITFIPNFFLILWKLFTEKYLSKKYVWLCSSKLFFINEDILARIIKSIYSNFLFTKCIGKNFSRKNQRETSWSEVFHATTCGDSCKQGEVAHAIYQHQDQIYKNCIKKPKSYKWKKSKYVYISYKICILYGGFIPQFSEEQKAYKYLRQLNSQTEKGIQNSNLLVWHS